MSKGPGFFSDIGKKGKDLLTKDYTYDQKFTISTYSNAGVMSTTLSIAEIMPSTKLIAVLKLPDYTSGKAEVQYLHNHATATIAVGLNQSPAVELSGTIGTPGFALGTEAAFDTASGTFAKYNAGISVTMPDSSSTIFLAEKGDLFKASYLHHLDQSQRSSAVAEITRRFSTNENTFTVGASYALDPLTAVKGRLNNHGK